MGTLQDQPPRNSYHYDLDLAMRDFIEISKKHKVPVETVIEANKVMELERRNKITVNNGDIHDEQMAGFGDIFIQMAEAIEGLKPEYQDE